MKGYVIIPFEMPNGGTTREVLNLMDACDELPYCEGFHLVVSEIGTTYIREQVIPNASKFTVVKRKQKGR